MGMFSMALKAVKKLGSKKDAAKGAAGATKGTGGSSGGLTGGNRPSAPAPTSTPAPALNFEDGPPVDTSGLRDVVKGFRTGGKITKSGAAYIHRGEKIVPAKKRKVSRSSRRSSR
jgi:hypothetical protein